MPSFENPASYRRPVLPGPDGRNTPVPWVGGYYPYIGKWAELDRDRSDLADAENLCIVCGVKLTPDWVYLRLYGRGYDYSSTNAELFAASLFGTKNASPSSTRVHPRCAVLGALYCPHLKSQPCPAETQDHQPLTVADLKKLMRDGN